MGQTGYLSHGPIPAPRMEATEISLSDTNVQRLLIVGIAIALYAALYRPVMSVLEPKPQVGEEDNVSVEDPGVKTGSVAVTSLFRDRLLLTTILSVFVLDQVSKYIVKSNLSLYESWPSEGLFRITYGTNSGTAFGLFPDAGLVLTVASFLAIGFLFYFYNAQTLSVWPLRLAIGLQLGGAFGNLTDRLRTGSVVDFIDIGWWPIFNVSDSSIVIGIFLLVMTFALAKEDEPGSESVAAGAGAITGAGSENEPEPPIPG